jgi:hypothetical protein
MYLHFFWGESFKYSLNSKFFSTFNMSLKEDKTFEMTSLPPVSRRNRKVEFYESICLFYVFVTTFFKSFLLIIIIWNIPRTPCRRRYRMRYLYWYQQHPPPLPRSFCRGHVPLKITSQWAMWQASQSKKRKRHSRRRLFDDGVSLCRTLN